VRWLDAHGLWTETETEAGAWARDVALVNLDRNTGTRRSLVGGPDGEGPPRLHRAGMIDLGDLVTGIVAAFVAGLVVGLYFAAQAVAYLTSRVDRAYERATQKARIDGVCPLCTRGWEYPPDAPPERIRRGTG
jgi:hypothetical protein